MEEVIREEQTSAEIGELACALSKVQGQIVGARRDSRNPYFNSKYADLASIWEACRKPLAENGFAVVQTMASDTDIVRVITRLIHSSGQWIKGELSLKPIKNDPQGMGFAITYARRYALAAMVGVSPEDDDGEVAMGRQKQLANVPALPQKKTTTSNSDDQRNLTKEAGMMLLEMSSQDKEKASQLLESLTAWKEGGKDIQGRKTLAGMSDKQIFVVYGKVKEEYAKWTKSKQEIVPDKWKGAPVALLEQAKVNLQMEKFTFQQIAADKQLEENFMGEVHRLFDLNEI